MAVRVVAAEILQPVIIDPEHLVRGLVVLHLGCGAEDAKDHLGVDAVAVHLLDAQMRVADALDVFLAVLEHAGLGHDVDALVLAGDQLGTAGADTVQQAEIGARFGDPMRSVGAVRDVRHAVRSSLEFLGGEKRGRHPGHIEMAIGGYSCCISWL